jgi:hypothetical protein
MGLISYGKLEKEIADGLCITPATVHAHTRNIRRKINAANIADITRYYIQHYERNSTKGITGNAGGRNGKDAPALRHNQTLRFRTSSGANVWPGNDNKSAKAWTAESYKARATNPVQDFRVVGYFIRQLMKKEVDRVEILCWINNHLTDKEIQALRAVADAIKANPMPEEKPSKKTEL